MDARRLIPIGAVVTVLLVLAGAASHGRPLRPGLGNGPSAVFFDYVATTFVLFALLVVIVVALALRTERAGQRKPPQRKWYLLSNLVTIAVSIALAFFIFHARYQRAQSNGQEGLPPPAQPHQRPKAQQQAKGLRNARLRWDEIAIVLALLGALGVYVAVTRAKPGTLRPLAERRRLAVSRAVGDSIDDLRRDPDLRRAIIAAYARMEDALGRAGVPRTASEAPFEYLERSLVELETSADSARTLTALFERAKFSQHEPAEPMRTEAIDALVAVRDDLTA